MEYILFIHNNTDTPIKEADWNTFFIAANESDLFQGGSEISNPIQFGEKAVSDITKSVAGFMRFESSNLDDVKVLLKKHPVLLSGGTLELCEMPKT